MIKNNLFGTILVILMVVFLLLASVQIVGIGTSIKEIAVTDDINEDLPKITTAVNSVNLDGKVDNTELVNVINARPIFSDSRLPYIEEEVLDPNEKEPIDIPELNAKLKGVVITPESSYAMIVDGVTKNREVYTVGMPLEGEQGGWSLTEITQRKVLLTSEDNKTTELELEVFGGTAGPANKSAKTDVASTNKTTELQEKLEKKKNADDIRKKIAERRAQMRAEALKKK